MIAPDPSSTTPAEPAAPAAARREWHTASDEETAAVGRALGETLSPGAVIHLFGDLGAGKTVFVRGLAAGLGIDQDEVSSPTFTLIQEYRAQGRHPLFHVDLTASPAPKSTISASTRSPPRASSPSNGPIACPPRNLTPSSFV